MPCTVLLVVLINYFSDAPDASKEFQAEQVQSFLRSLDGGEGPSWQDDQKYHQFFAPSQPPGHPREAWADEFGAHPSAHATPFKAPMGAAGPSTQWANEFQVKSGCATSTSVLQCASTLPSMSSRSLIPNLELEIWQVCMTCRGGNTPQGTHQPGQRSSGLVPRMRQWPIWPSTTAARRLQHGQQTSWAAEAKSCTNHMAT